MDSNLELLFTRHSTKDFVVTANNSLTYAEVFALIQNKSNFLREQGLSAPSLCGYLGDHSLESIVNILALLLTGSSVVLMNNRWSEMNIGEIAQSFGISHFITAKDSSVSVKQLDTVCSNFALVSPSVVIGTSGSSGIPKLAVLSLDALLKNALGSNEYIPLIPGDIWALSLPLFHVGGLGILLRSLLAGSTIYLSNPSEPLGSAESISHISLVPTQLYRLLKDKSLLARLQKLRVILLGGAPIPANLLREGIKQLGQKLYPTYGMTEMGSQITTAHADIKDSGEVSLGKPLRFRQIKISSDGEILVRGECLFSGYLTRDGLNLPLDSGGWFNTGDLGRISAGGELTVVGRKDAQFISGGENINPESIELALSNIPGIVAACVVPIDDQEYGKRPLAFVLSEVELDAEIIRSELKSHIPSFAIPKKIIPAPAEMVTASGKLNRALAVELAKNFSLL